MNVNQFKLYINKTDELNLIMRIKYIRVLMVKGVMDYQKAKNISDNNKNNKNLSLIKHFPYFKKII